MRYLRTKIAFYLVLILALSCEETLILNEEQILEIMVPKIFLNHDLNAIKRISSQKFKNTELPHDYYLVELTKNNNKVLSFYMFYEGSLFQIGKSLECILLKQEVFVTPDNTLITNIKGYQDSKKAIKKLKSFQNNKDRIHQKDLLFYKKIVLSNTYCD